MIGLPRTTWNVWIGRKRAHAEGCLDCPLRVVHRFVLTVPPVASPAARGSVSQPPDGCWARVALLGPLQAARRHVSCGKRFADGGLPWL